MQVINNFDITLDKSVATIGTFDGVHKGHRKLIELLCRSAARTGGQSVVITFRTHPRKVLGNKGLKLLTPGAEKIELFENLCVDTLVYTDFTPEIAQMTAVEFVEKVLIKKFKIKYLIVGFNHRFGKGRSGDYQTLVKLRTKYSFEVLQAPPVYCGDEPVSSTLIRKYLSEGSIKSANNLLGYNYFLHGEVIQGDKFGRKLGFPTANLAVSQDKFMPKFGVYVVRVFLGEQEYFGVLNYGVKPTLGGKFKAVPEVHIMNFNSEIYGQEIKVEFLARLRDEKKFSTVEELKRQIKTDLNQAHTFLRKV